MRKRVEGMRGVSCGLIPAIKYELGRQTRKHSAATVVDARRALTPKAVFQGLLVRAADATRSVTTDVLLEGMKPEP